VIRVRACAQNTASPVLADDVEILEKVVEDAKPHT
jgi:hypothetical protein